MNPIHTGCFIREQRKKLNLSQSKLAEMLGVEPQTVSKWERGVGFPDYPNVLKLAEIFSCSVQDILEPQFEDESENENEDENKDKEEVKTESVTTQTPVVEQAPAPASDPVPSQAFQPQTYQQYYNPAQPYRADGPTQMESYVSPQTNPTPPQYVSPQESDVKPTMSSSKPLIFRTRMDPNLLIYEYSDRLVFYKKTLNGLEHVKTERKDPLK
jgi:transcriptional regulator with XRE-family HTH domain